MREQTLTNAMDFQTWRETKAKRLVAWGRGPASKAIVSTLARFKIRAEVRARHYGPRTIHFTIAYGVSHSVSSILLRLPDLALALGVDPNHAAMAQTGRGVVLTIPNPEPYTITRADLKDGRGLDIPVGVRADGCGQYHISFSDTLVNLLIVGPTRTGKSTALQTLIFGLASQNPTRKLEIALINPKNDPVLGGFAHLQHLRYPVAVNAKDAVAILRDLADEVQRRIENGTRRPAHLVLVVDELISLMQNPVYGTVAREALLPIVSMGGGLGVITIATTQKTDKRSLGDSLIADNFTNRLIGAVASGQASAQAAGLAELNAHKLLGAGDFIAKIGGVATRIQIATTPSDLIAKLPTWATVAPTLPERAVPEMRNGAGRPVKPLDPADVEFVQDHADQLRSVHAVQKLLGGCGRKYAARVAEAAGLNF